MHVSIYICMKYGIVPYDILSHACAHSRLTSIMKSTKCGPSPHSEMVLLPALYIFRH